LPDAVLTPSEMAGLLIYSSAFGLAFSEGLRWLQFLLVARKSRPGRLIVDTIAASIRAPPASPGACKDNLSITAFDKITGWYC